MQSPVSSPPQKWHRHITINKTTVRELREHGGDELFAASWAEVHGEGELAVDWVQYQALEDAGLLTLLAAYADGELVGYSAMALLPGLHTSELLAENLSLFVKPEVRHLGLGMQLIRLTQLSADEAGAKLRWRTRSGQALDRLLPNMGYTATDEVVYVKGDGR